MNGTDTTRDRARAGWFDASGRGRLGSLLALLVVGLLVYAGMKLVPVRAAAYQMDDAVREQVVLAAARRGRVTEEGVRAALVERAEELGLPVGPQNVEVDVRRESIEIQVQYEVRVEFPLGLGFTWPFTTSHTGPIV